MAYGDDCYYFLKVKIDKIWLFCITKLLKKHVWLSSFLSHLVKNTVFCHVFVRFLIKNGIFQVRCRASIYDFLRKE